MNMDNMNDTSMDDSPLFKPDPNVVYPNKQELYRRETVSPVRIMKPLMIAASLLLISGFLWWLVVGNQPDVPAVVMVSEKSNSPIEKKSAAQQEQHLMSLPVVVDKKIHSSRKALSVSASVDIVPQVDIISAENTEIQLQQDIQQNVTSVAIESPSVSIIEDQLQKDAQTVAANVSVEGTSSSDNPEVYIPMSVASEKKKSFRGLTRKLSRTILGEGESLGEEGIIRVANFKIPVSN